MARYQVKHTFPSPYVTHVGQIFTDPEWPNLQVLVSQGYLTLLDDEPVAKEEKADKPAAAKAPKSPAKASEKTK